ASASGRGRCRAADRHAYRAPLTRSAMGQQELILKCATRTTPSGELKHDDYDVLCDDKVVGRIMKAAAAPVGTPWLWTFAMALTATTPPPTAMRWIARKP